MDLSKFQFHNGLGDPGTSKYVPTYPKFSSRKNSSSFNDEETQKMQQQAQIQQ